MRMSEMEGILMNIRVEQIIVVDENRMFKVGDTVTIHFLNGGGMGGCTITKITNKGFHFNQGKGRDKSAAFEKLKSVEIERSISNVVDDMQNTVVN